LQVPHRVAATGQAQHHQHHQDSSGGYVAATCRAHFLPPLAALDAAACLAAVSLGST
jgi:hypothetical protein